MHHDINDLDYKFQYKTIEPQDLLYQNFQLRPNLPVEGNNQQLWLKYHHHMYLVSEDFSD